MEPQEFEAGGASFPGNDLAQAFAAIWQAFEMGVQDRRHAFHTPALVTNGLDGPPKARIVVLRHADPQAATLRCHTDVRSPKVSELAADLRVGLLAYDPSAKLQVRLEGTAWVESKGPIADAAWASSTLWARRCYAAPFVPGADTGGPHGNLPDDMAHRQPTEEEAEAGRGNFAIILATIDKIDWLYLEASGHRRGVHRRSENGWVDAWVAP